MAEPANRATPPDPPGTKPSRPTRLLMVRHGQSKWNDEGRIQGQLDPPLSELGDRQARLAAERFRGRTFGGFYTSDLLRCRMTAAAIAEVIGQEPEPLPDLREIALGEWEGLTRDEIVDRYPELWKRWSANPNWDIPPGGEGAVRFESRVEGALDRIVAAHPHQEVLIVTHGGVIQVALAGVVGGSVHGLFPFVIDNTSLTTFLRGPKRSAVAGVNDTCHLSDGAHSTRSGDFRPTV